jgi:O-antigen/teichoic acid export membrane protein
VGVRHVLREWLGVDRAIAFTGIRFAHRVLDPFTLALLFINVPINVVLFSQATYLRAHKQEKLLLISVLPAILVGLSTYFLGKSYGAMGVVTGSVLTNVILGLPLGTCVFAQCRRLWHAQ